MPVGVRGNARSLREFLRTLVAAVTEYDEWRFNLPWPASRNIEDEFPSPVRRVFQRATQPKVSPW